MSVSEQLARIQADKSKLKNKAVELGIADSTANLDALAAAFEGVENRGAVSAQVQEGDTYTIPKGYHNGSGTVSGVSGGGNYQLQSKSATPTKAQQNITPDSGYYGLSDVTIGAIPETYQDVTGVTAGAADVLEGKVIVNASGESVEGSMNNNGEINATIDGLTVTSYNVPAGYTAGGTVSLTDDIEQALAAI